MNDSHLKRAVESFRDWGRDCYCPSGKDNTCQKRFGWQLGELPEGYDHKYIYRHLGFNLKATDLQAAIGVAQLKKLDSFIEARQRNWAVLREASRMGERFCSAESDASFGSFLVWICTQCSRECSLHPEGDHRFPGIQKNSNKDAFRWESLETSRIQQDSNGSRNPSSDWRAEKYR